MNNLDKIIPASLNEIIDYFKFELTLTNQECEEKSQSRKFNLNLSILFFSGIIVLIGSFINMATSLLSKDVMGVALYLFIISMIFVIYSIWHYIYYDLRDSKTLGKKVNSLNIILAYLNYLKIRGVSVEEIRPLLNRVYFESGDFRIRFIKNRKDYWAHQITRMDEFIEAIDKINIQMIKKDNNEKEVKK